MNGKKRRFESAHLHKKGSDNRQGLILMKLNLIYDKIR